MGAGTVSLRQIRRRKPRWRGAIPLHLTRRPAIWGPTRLKQDWAETPSGSCFRALREALSSGKAPGEVRRLPVALVATLTLPAVCRYGHALGGQTHSPSSFLFSFPIFPFRSASLQVSQRTLLNPMACRCLGQGRKRNATFQSRAAAANVYCAHYPPPLPPSSPVTATPYASGNLASAWTDGRSGGCRCLPPSPTHSASPPTLHDKMKAMLARFKIFQDFLAPLGQGNVHTLDLTPRNPRVRPTRSSCEIPFCIVQYHPVQAGLHTKSTPGAFSQGASSQSGTGGTSSAGGGVASSGAAQSSGLDGSGGMSRGSSPPSSPSPPPPASASNGNGGLAIPTGGASQLLTPESLSSFGTVPSTTLASG